MKKLMIKYLMLGGLSMLAVPLITSCSSSEDATDVGIGGENYTPRSNFEFSVNPVLDSETRAAGTTTNPDDLWLTQDNCDNFALFITPTTNHSSYVYKNLYMHRVISGTTESWTSYTDNSMSSSFQMLCQADSIQFASCGYAPWASGKTDKTHIDYNVSTDQSTAAAVKASDFLVYPEDTIDPDYLGTYRGYTIDHLTVNPNRPNFNIRMLPQNKTYDVNLYHAASKILITVQMDASLLSSSQAPTCSGPGLASNPISNPKIWYVYTSGQVDLTYDPTRSTAWTRTEFGVGGSTPGSGTDWAVYQTGSKGQIVPYEMPTYVPMNSISDPPAEAHYMFIMPSQNTQFGFSFDITNDGETTTYYYAMPAEMEFCPGKVYQLTMDISYEPLPPGSYFVISGGRFTVTPWVVQSVPSYYLGTE